MSFEFCHWNSVPKRLFLHNESAESRSKSNEPVSSCSLVFAARLRPVPKIPFRRPSRISSQVVIEEFETTTEDVAKAE